MAAPFRQTSRTSYQDFQQQISPTALLSKNGAAFEAALGAMKDFALDRMIASVKARFPGIAPSDALNVIGAERGIPRGGSEGDLGYASRLMAAWTTWPWAGTPYGMLTAFRSTGYTNVVLAQSLGGKQFTLDVNGNLVTGGNGSWTMTYVGDPFWSRFDVVFPTPLPASWQSGGVPAASSNEANFIRALVAAWKPGHATCNRISVIAAPAVKWGDQNWAGFTYSAVDGTGDVYGLQPTFWGARNWAGFNYRNPVWGSPAKWNGTAWGLFNYSVAASTAPAWGGDTTVIWRP